MKIAYLMDSHNADSELWLRRQIDYLNRDIVAIGVLNNTLSCDGDIPVVNLLWDAPIHQRVTRKLGFRSNPGKDDLEKNFRKFLIKYRPEIIVVNYLTLAYKLRSVLGEFKGKVFIQVHGYDVCWDYISPDTLENIHPKDYLGFAKGISNTAVYIANSQYTAANLISVGIPKNKIEVRYFGVSAGKKPLIASSDSFRILYLGRLVDCKAPDLVIKAFDMACHQGLKGELIIAGDGYMRLSCMLEKNRSKFSDKISLIGPVTAAQGEELRALCDVFTLHNCKGPVTHQVEAFGVAIIEAMAAGMPVITGKSGGVVESVVHEETGYLFEPGNIEEQAKYFLRLYRDRTLLQKFGNLAYDRAVQHFSILQEREKMLRILGA